MHLLASDVTCAAPSHRWHPRYLEHFRRLHLQMQPSTEPTARACQLANSRAFQSFHTCRISGNLFPCGAASALPSVHSLRALDSRHRQHTLQAAPSATCCLTFRTVLVLHSKP